MRSQKLHSQADMYLLGYTTPNIHVLMDAPVKALGAQHRQVNHSISMVTSIEALYGKKSARVALLHLLLDLDIIDSKFIEKEVTRMVKEYLSTKEVSERFSVRESTVRSWIKEGRLKAIKMGKQWRVTIADCDSLITD